MKGKNGRWAQIGFLLAVIVAVTILRQLGVIGPSVHELKRYSVTYTDAFDTVIQVIGYSPSEEEFTEKVSLLHDRMLLYHSYFDIYHEYPGINNIKTINDHAGQGPVEVNDEIMELLELGCEVYDLSNKQVNIAMGGVLQIWHEYRQNAAEDPENASIPNMEELKEAKKHSGIREMVLDKENKTVEILDPKVSLDVGSIGKGLAAEWIKEYAIELGFEHMLISFGGNIVTIGTRPDGSKWQVGVENPFYQEGDASTGEAYSATVSVSGECMVTSGDYQRYYMVDGKKYCHIIDPDTLMPGDEFSSVTIKGMNSALADALSTALFNLSLEDGQEIIESLEGYEAMWITTDGEVIATDGF